MAKKKTPEEVIKSASEPTPSNDKHPSWLQAFEGPTSEPSHTGFETYKGDSDYDKGLVTGYNQNSVRAYNQPWYDQLGNAVGKAALKVVPSIIGNIASMVDFEDYYNQDKEVGNAVTKAMEDLKSKVDEDVLPIYRANPDKSLDLGDSGWWFDNGSNLLESAGSFVATGGIVGRGLSFINNLAKLGQAGEAAATLLTTVGLNQAESIPSAMQVYDKVHKDAVTKGLSDEDAKQKAADAAAYTININRLNIPLNLTSSLAFLRSPRVTRQLIKDVNLSSVTGHVNAEGLQEAGEELINMVAEKEGERSGTEDGYKYNFARTLKDVFSKEGVENALLGYLGGAIQTGGQALLNHVTGATAEQRQAHLNQKNYIDELNNITSSSNIPSLAATFNSLQDQATLHSKIQRAAETGDIDTVNKLQHSLLDNQAYHSFENGAANKLEDTYRHIASYSNDEAIAKGLDIDPHSDNYYKKKAQDAISRIKELEKTYTKAASRFSPDKLKPAYDNLVENDNIRREIKDVDSDIREEQLKAQDEVNAGLDLHETSNYEILGDLQKKKDGLVDQLRKNAEQFKQILTQPSSPSMVESQGQEQSQETTPSTEPTKETKEKVVKTPKNVSEDDRSIIKEFENTSFNSTDELQQHVANFPESVKQSQQFKQLKKGKLTNLELKDQIQQGIPVQVKKSGRTVTAVPLSPMYREMSGNPQTHVEVLSNGKPGSIFTPDTNKTINTKEKHEPDVEPTSNAAPIDKEVVPDIEPLPPDYVDPIPDIELLTPDQEANIANAYEKEKEKRKPSKVIKQKEISTEIKNKDQHFQLTIDKENDELASGIGQKIGYDYARLNNPSHLNGEIRLSLGYVEGIDAPFVFVEEKNNTGEWVKVTKLMRTLSGVSNEIQHQFQGQFDRIVEYLKNNGSVVTKVLDKKLDNYLNINKGVQSSIELLTTNDRAKSNLPDGQIYIGTVKGGIPQVRDIDNNGNGGTVQIGINGQQTEGRHFIVLLAPNGTLVPAYLQDTPIKDIKVNDKPLMDEIKERIESIKQSFMDSALPKTQTALNKYWNAKRDELITPLVDINRGTGKRPFKVGLKLQPNGNIVTYVSGQDIAEDAVYNSIADRFFNIQASKLISDPKYTDFLVSNRILTTDLNTERPITGTQLKVDIGFLTSPGRIHATEPETPGNGEQNVEQDEELRKLQEELNPLVDPTKVNDIKTKQVFERDYKQLDIKGEMQWLKDNLPQIPTEVLDSTLSIAKKFGVEAHGIFSNAIIYLAENGMEGTAYHEAYHAVETLYLSPEQVTKLDKETGLTEEERAEKFREYVISEGNEPPHSALRRFFKDIYLWIKNRLGLLSMNDLFYRINTGKYKDSPIKNKTFLPVNKYKVVEGFNPLEQRQRINTLLYQVFNGLKSMQSTGSIISIDPESITKENYDALWTKINRLWELTDKATPNSNRKKVLDKWEEFKELTTKELSRFGLETINREEEEKEGEDTKERIYDRAFFKSNLKDTVSREIKLFIATIPQIEEESKYIDKAKSGEFTYKKDDLGNLMFIDYHEYFNYLSKELCGIGSVEGVVNKLEQLAIAKPQLYYILDFLKKSPSVEEGDVKSNNFRNKFYTTFRNQYIRFLTVRKRRDRKTKEYRFEIFETNKRSLDRTILSKWKESHKGQKTRDVYTPFATAVRKDAKAIDNRENNAALKVVQNSLRDIGIEISLPALVLYRDDFYRKEPRGSFSNHLIQYGVRSIGQMMKAFSNGTNIFGEGEELGEYAMLKDLAKYEAKVNSDITNGSFLNGENEMVYPINAPTFASNRVTELRENINNILNNLSAVPYYTNSRVLAELRDPKSKFREEFDVFTYDTFTDDTKRKGGISYDQTQDYEFVVSKLNLFHNQGGKFGYFLPPTPSDRGNVSAFKLPKLNLANTPLFIGDKLNHESDFYIWLTGAVEDEFNRIKQTWEQIESIPEDQQILNYHYKILDDGTRVRGNAFYFNMFHNLNNLLYDDVSNPELKAERIQDVDGLFAELDNTFVRLFENEKKKLSDKGIINYNDQTKKLSLTSGVLDNRVTDSNEFVEQYIANQFYSNVELTRMLSGDIAFYKGSPLSTKDRATQYADVDKRFGQSFVPGKELAHSTVYSDVVKPTFRIQVGDDVNISSPLQELNAKYGKNNQTDAQGFITLERLRDILIGQGLFTPKAKAAWTRIKNGGTDASDISTVFQPIKGFYYSQDIVDGLSIPTQVKYSTVPLIPAFINQYPELQRLETHMRANSIDEFVFESGIKVGRKQNSILELQNKNWRMPQVVPYKDSTEERFGSQKRKLIVENIDEQDIKQRYQELIAKTIEDAFKETAPQLANLDKVATTILEQLKSNNSKGLPDMYEKSLEVIETKYGKDTRISLDNPLIKKRVEAIFNSFIDSRVVDQKLPGFSAVQVSTYGQVHKASDLKFVRKEGNKVHPAEVKVSPKYFLKVMKKQGVDINNFLTENGELDITKIPAELRKGTLHRIPTQGKNSMLPFTITEFTPSEYGSVIFLPVEVTTQAGSDFDIDKVFIELYNFKHINGKLEKIASGMDSKKARQNAIMDIHYDILTNPKYFNELITPNNTDNLSRIKTEVQKPDQMEQYWFSPWLQEEFKGRNQAGKQLVGFYSIQSVSHAVAQELDMQLAPGNMVAFEGERSNDLGRVKDIHGNLISDNIAERQTAAVDNAKDPILGYLNDNLFTAPVKSLIIRAGFPLDCADYFTVQPVIVDLTKLFYKYSPSMNEDKALQLAVGDTMRKYNITGLISNATPTNFTIQSLKDGLNGKIDSKAVLETFLTYKKLGDALYKVSLGLTADRKGTASTMAENLYNEEVVDRAKENPYITFNIEKYNQHSLRAFEKYGIEDAINIARQYFSDGTKTFRTVLDRFKAIKGESLSVKEIQDITYNFYTYLHTSNKCILGQTSPEERQSLLKGPNSVASRVKLYIETVKSKPEVKNLFLDNLLVTTDKETGFQFVDFNATANQALSAEEKQMLSDSILDLYNKGGNKREFAIDLLKYCFITNGFNRGVNGFIDYIPIEMFEDLGLSDFYRDTKQNFEDPDGFNLERFEEQYIANNHNDLYWVPSYSKKTEAKSVEEDQPSYYFSRATERLLARTDNGDYVEINQLGIPGKLKEYSIDGDIDSIISTNNKANNQVDSEVERIDSAKLHTILEGLSKRFGIKYELDEDLPVLGRFKNGVVIINPLMARSDTPFHEFAHPFIHTIKKQNPVLYNNLVRQITETTEGKTILGNVKRLYKDSTTTDQIEEAIVTAIGQYAVSNIKTPSLLQAIKTFFSRVINTVKEIVLGPNKLSITELSPNTTIAELGAIVAGEQYIPVELDSNTKDSREIEKAEKIVNDAIQVLQKKILIYKKKGSKGYLEREKKILDTLQSSLESKQFDQAVVTFLSHVRKEVNLIKEELNSVEDKGGDNEKARVLKAMRAYINSYRSIIEEVGDELENVPEIAEAVDGLNEDVDKIERRYFKLATPLFAKFLGQFKGKRGEGKELNIADSLTDPSKDISFFQRWLDAVAESSDDIIKLIDKSVKTAKERARLRSIDTQHELMTAKKELEKSGVKDTKFMYEIHSGKLTGNLVTEYNQGAFKESMNKMYKRSEEVSDIVERKKYIKQWWRENSIRRGKEYVPADKYKNSQYNTIQNNPAMKKFYDLVWTIKQKSDKLLPEDIQKKVQYLAPQMKKDILERLKSVDKSKVKQVLESIKDAFVVNENDTEFGEFALTDEQGKPVNFLPTFFTRPLSAMEDLSTDIVSTLSSYNYMAEDLGEMNKVVHLLEIGKDVLEKRRVSTGKIDPVTGKEITKAGNESNTYKRLEDYYNMVVYGRYKADEGKIGDTSIDKAKAIDTFGRYVAINSLALNVFSGISNITYGSAMIRTEAIAKEFISHSDLLFADKTYSKELPGVLGDVGQRLQTNKLSLWIDKFNTMQDFDQNLRDIEGNRKTVFGRLFKTSSLFFLNKAGEHWMQTRMSLALANKYKVKGLDGKESSLWDAMEVKEGKLVPKAGYDITEKDIIKFTLKQNFLNKRLHGVYSTVDRSAIQKYALGRMAMMFRKFIKPGWNKRFEKLTFNEEGEVWTEGYYNTTWRFLGQLKRDLIAGQFSVKKSWNSLSETEKRNMFRTFAEVGYMVAAATLAGVLTQLADDDDENWLLSMSAYQANRLYTELRFYSSWSQGVAPILKSPAAGVNQIQSLIDFIWVPEWFDTIESGKNAGMTKFEKNAIKVVPFYNTIRKITSPEEELIYFKK